MTHLQRNKKILAFRILIREAKRRAAAFTEAGLTAKAAEETEQAEKIRLRLVAFLEKTAKS